MTVVERLASFNGKIVSLSRDVSDGQQRVDFQRSFN